MAGFPINKAAGYRVVLECGAGDPGQQEMVLDSIEALLGALGSRTEVAVVAHGAGLGLVSAKDDGGRAGRIARLAEQGVVFLACARSLQAGRVAREGLLPGVATVDSGVAELVRRQTVGWSYLKGG